ncbi:hypothetical protein D9757_004821 [Collybiopsis confluens]|uniref:Uncharacterized protein n=1 Tax=Collybiopsis confluens TaxID=2823264 RepID=A0A8H5MCA3_9AGAR|nr:hypothetical protein D9757_004821 [Collybiopsis confluens]
MRWSIVTVLAFASTLVARPTPPNQFRDTYNHTELNRQLNNRSFGRDSQTKVSFFLPTTSLNGIKGHFKQNNPFVPVEMGKQTQSNVQSFMEGIAQDKLKVSPESVKLTQSKIVYKDKEGKRIAFLVQIPDSPNKVCGPKNICIGVISDGVLINPSK